MDGMVTYTVQEFFSDGNLREEFEKLGYPCEWKPGKVRTIPRALALRAQQSGARFEVPAEGDVEDRIIVTSPPVLINSDQAVKLYQGRFKGERVRVMCQNSHGFEDGNLSEALEAIDHYPQIGFGEIIELPPALLTRLEASGFEWTDSPEEMAQFDNQQFQARYTHPLEAWRAERAAKKAADAARIDQEKSAVDIAAQARAKVIKTAKLTDEEAAALGLL